MFSWFAYLSDGPKLDGPALDDLAERAAHVPGAEGGFVLSPLPAAIDQPFAADGPGPTLTVQLHFPTMEALEAAASSDGPLLQLWNGLPAPRHQAMLRRRFPVPDATLRTPPGQHPCSFLVQYPGPAADVSAWHAHYNTHHPPVMARFPGVRLIEIYKGLDWATGLPWPRDGVMQRNKLMFDTPAALTAALQTPVMADMRADFNRFPPFEGGNKHHPHETRPVGRVP